MILEVASLQVRPGQKSQFEAAFLQAQKIISGMPGFRLPSTAALPGAA